MCWRTEKKPIAYKARKDIVCYKIVHRIKPNSNAVYSKIFWFEYYFNKLYKTTLSKINHGFEGYTIEEGFHSFKEEPIVWNNFYITSNNGFYNIYYNSIIECVIPTGSTYYKNAVGELVSNQIKLIRCVGIHTKNQS